MCSIIILMKNQFPIFKTYENLSYLDNAATTQKPQVVIDSIIKFYSKYNSNVHRGLYELSDKATELFENSRKKVAEFFNVREKNIFFSSGATESINGIAIAMESLFTKDDAILVTNFEHHSNLLPWQNLALKTGAELVYLEFNSDNEFDINELNKLLDKHNNIRLAAITACSNVTGTIVPLKEVAEVLNRKNIVLAVDGSQLVAHKKIDLNEIKLDFFTFSGHKTYAPMGIGASFISDRLMNLLTPYKLGGGIVADVQRKTSSLITSVQKFEAGTPNVEGAYSLSVALEYIRENFEFIEKHEKLLINKLKEELQTIPEIEIYSAKENQSSVLSFNIKNIHSHDVAQILSQENIAVRAGHHCCRILIKDKLNKDAAVRVSFAIYNTEEDIEKLINAIKKVINTFS